MISPLLDFGFSSYILSAYIYCIRGNVSNRPAALSRKVGRWRGNVRVGCCGMERNIASLGIVKSVMRLERRIIILLYL